MGYFLWVTCSFGILFLSEIIIMYIRGGCVCRIFCYAFSCVYWVIFNSVYALKNSSLINRSGINLKDKQIYATLGHCPDLE